jgi:hypothetical protein
MFDAQTPMRVRKRLSDIKAGLASVALIGAIFRMVTTPVVGPFQWIFAENQSDTSKNLVALPTI